MDNTTSYDGKYVYYNQRLGNAGDSWYFIWYNEMDSWVINQAVPTLPTVQSYEGICRSEVDTPDLCPQSTPICWEYYESYTSEQNCAAQLASTTSLIESDCMSIPTNSITTPTASTALCFDDGQGGNNVITNTYSGFYEVTSLTALYGGRNYWIKYDDLGNAEYYLYYDETWRYWVISTAFSTDESQWNLYCLEWRDFEPWNCNTWYSKAEMTTYTMQICTETPSQAPTKAPTEYPTDVGCSSNYAFVNVISSDPLGLQETLTSMRTDFPPYAYRHNIIHRELVLFADGDALTVTYNNPCDVSTWNYLPAFYNGKIVMIDLDDVFMAICNIQQMVLNIETYADVKAILLANNKDLTHVYSLEGDMTLNDPTIPTRMISQIGAQNIKNEIIRTQAAVSITIDCFEEQHPTMICVLDQEIYGTYAKFDGEYQQQSM